MPGLGLDDSPMLTHNGEHPPELEEQSLMETTEEWYQQPGDCNSTAQEDFQQAEG